MKLVAILNITPDSFSDGGLYMQPDEAIKKTNLLIAQGAEILDIGAESRRPGEKNICISRSRLISSDEEWARLSPVLQDIISLCKKHGVETSIDTRDFASAKKAVALGIDWINEASGLASDEMLSLIADSGVKTVLLHLKDIVANHKDSIIPTDQDLISELIDFAHRRIASLQKSGLHASQITFDPGIGFGKTHLQSWEIIRQISKIKNSIDVPIYIAHSRKSFLSTVTGQLQPHERDPFTCAVTNFLVSQGVDFIRVHNIEMHKQFFKIQDMLATS